MSINVAACWCAQLNDPNRPHLTTRGTSAPPATNVMAAVNQNLTWKVTASVGTGAPDWFSSLRCSPEMVLPTGCDGTPCPGSGTGLLPMQTIAWKGALLGLMTIGKDVDAAISEGGGGEQEGQMVMGTGTGRAE